MKIKFPPPYQHPPLPRTDYDTADSEVADLIVSSEAWKRIVALVERPPEPSAWLRALRRLQ